MGNIICCRNGDCSKIAKESKNTQRQSVADDNPIPMGTLERQPRSEKEKLEEEALRNRLKYEYSNPCQRWKMRDKPLHTRIPIKLIIQMLKIFFVTTQLILVGLQRKAFADYSNQSNNALKNLLLKDIKLYPDNEELSDPIDAPDYNIYTKEDLFSHINFAVSRFPEVPNRAMGSFYFTMKNGTSKQQMDLCLTYYKSSQFFSINNTLNLDPGQKTDCFVVTALENSIDARGYTYNISDFLLQNNQLQNIDRMLSLRLRFSLKKVHFSEHIDIWGVDCFNNDGTIEFDHNLRTGEVYVSLKTVISTFDCQGSHPTSWRRSGRDVTIAVFVILLNITSIVLCFISIRNSIILVLDTRALFAKRKNENGDVTLRHKDNNDTQKKTLSLSEQFDLLKIWDVLVVINDVCTIAGTIVLMCMGNADLVNMYDAATTLLGVGGLLVWMGILRYFSFFPEFYLLFLILRRALKSVVRYIICVVILYGGFVFCGWLVLGPYHRKFRTLESAAECLFATMNGDELYETFVGITRTTGYIWWFSRIYLYVFIGLFSTIALNLFIAICMDSYETVKMFCKEGFPPSVLMTFIQGDDVDNDEDAPYFCTKGFVTETTTYVEERPKTTLHERPKTVAFDVLRLDKDDGATLSFRA